MRSGQIGTSLDLSRILDGWPLLRVRPVLMAVGAWQDRAREAAETLFEDHPVARKHVDPGSLVHFEFNADPAIRRDEIATLKAAAIEAFDARWAELTA